MSKETKFTKGELEVSDESVFDGNGYLIVEFNGDRTYNREDEANALLFKTAPKLYAEIESDIEFLKELREDSHTEYQITLLDEKIEQKQNLLAEARGE